MTYTTRPERLSTTKRKQFSKNQRAHIAKVRGNVCDECGLQIEEGQKWAVEHRVALMNGGTNHIDNLGMIHYQNQDGTMCHQRKTKRDHTTCHKIKNMQQKHHGIEHFKPKRQSKIQSRGFEKRPPKRVEMIERDWDEM